MRAKNPSEDEYKQLLANMGRKTPVSSSGERHPKGVNVGEPRTKDAVKRNQSTEGQGNVKSGDRTQQGTKLSFELIIVGQIKSGKNRILITRTGHRYPPEAFKVWRDEVVSNLSKQWRYDPITVPVRLHCTYWPGDRRTRDVPGMEDALLHVLVKAGVLKDDGLVYDLLWYRQPMNRKGPKVLITVQEWEA